MKYRKRQMENPETKKSSYQRGAKGWLKKAEADLTEIQKAGQKRPQGVEG